MSILSSTLAILASLGIIEFNFYDMWNGDTTSMMMASHFYSANVSVEYPCHEHGLRYQAPNCKPMVGVTEIHNQIAEYRRAFSNFTCQGEQVPIPMATTGRREYHVGTCVGVHTSFSSLLAPYGATNKTIIMSHVFYHEYDNNGTILVEYGIWDAWDLFTNFYDISLAGQTGKVWDVDTTSVGVSSNYTVLRMTRNKCSVKKPAVLVLDMQTGSTRVIQDHYSKCFFDT